MTKKEEVRAKIVEVCPDLMELSFGCEIKQKYSIRPYTKVISNIEECLDEGRYIVTTGGLTHYKVYLERTHPSDNYIIEILGHPIQLHHVLRTVGDNDWEMRLSKPLVLMISNNKEVYWNLSKPFDDQEEEVFEFLHTIIC